MRHSLASVAATVLRGLIPTGGLGRTQKVVWSLTHLINLEEVQNTIVLLRSPVVGVAVPLMVHPISFLESLTDTLRVLPSVRAQRRAL